MSKESKRSGHFRSAIAAFIEARREVKLKGKEDDAEAAAKYEYAAWLADAARRVTQIQAVTHVLKASHPDARGSSLHAEPETLPSHAEVGSHLLRDSYSEDIVGNAAALDVFKFLKLEVENRRLLDWMRDGDPDLRDALSADAELASGWMEAFSSLVRSNTAPVSHEMAKQVYWLIGNEPARNDQYHLLQPMFSSSLAHAVHADIQDARFGEANKLARQAFRAKETYNEEYRDYRNLIARKLGGTKPQNVSQLNSERGGVNYLLASLPPKWQQERKPRLLNLDSAVERFAWYEGVPFLLRKLAAFLKSVADKPRNMDLVEKREAIEQALGQQLALFAVSIRASLEPGWTRDPDCTLPLCEKLWLDPERTELPLRRDPEQADDDRAFNAAYTFGDWPDEVAGRFANWVNERLREAGLTAVSEVEYRHWAKQAIIDAAWPVPMQRRASAGGEA
ncbi:type I-F CRISPR-associated protein Csy1 [Salinicola sp. LHM]|jgi:CRISPR-associated protein Csy1|uniref:type I-F CRISPR-associated protein Csy1 n=1 Tax=unclassified Salinicola TaxID=2634022 RepID=UPI0008DE6805|nr:MULTISPECIES: type I-F CRISPR-associated protein Csy1 [unclassified Salinicola]OHZ02761.1 type I-F CRISPR-associated protein Csy1 [Salinicola sp. MIT1003]WQH32678.1 type I-F CRISPR-associated protein Csy1 [Salinicola sp. LHM]